MKKTLFGFFVASILVLSGLQANVEQNIIKIIQQQTGKKISVLKVDSLQSNPEFKIAIIQDLDTQYKIPVFVSKDGNIVIGLSNVFFSDNQKDATLVNEIYKKTQDFNTQQQNSAKLNRMFESIPDDYVISLPSSVKGNKKIVYIVSDPMCPHCQQELREIDSRLKDANVKMVVVGFLGKNSIIKSALILEKIKSAKTPGEKITILKQVYSPAYEAKDASQKDMKRVENITKKVSDTEIINYVPYIYEYKK
ncbi:disulfide isomerase [Helicobacter sp. 11S03491-1]|uniref:DsbA family protein n=1 Tax=Helicobacter sp. 11S03491-1 TaxID=1476196 RepID=UPI000BA57CDC|nr:disulfide isomerase [Helicobacter sp. 11S03491-1]PAF42588.1 disulfide isomerase [Helicobacter sp. 11S03491-1]